MGSAWVIQAALSPARVSLRDRRGETQTREGGHIATEDEPGLPGAGRGGKDPPSEVPEGVCPGTPGSQALAAEKSE